MALSVVDYRSFVVQIILFAILCNEISGRVTSGPQNALRKFGESVTFSCSSDYDDTILWKFSCDRCNQTGRDRHLLVDGDKILLDNFVTTATVAVTYDGVGGRVSTLTITAIDGSHDGTYTCVDDMWDTATAHLTVTNASSSHCLSVSPRDVIASVGDIVYLEGQSSQGLRWYRTSHDHENMIFDSKSMNLAKFDNRYDVMTGSDGRADLVIRDVRVTDAGLYIASNDIEQIQVPVNVVVIEHPMKCHVTSVSFRSARIQCGFKYSGLLKPTITWKGEDITESSLTQSTTGGTVESSREVALVDLFNENATRWTASFSLSRCGEVIDHYTLSMNTDNIGVSSYFVDVLATWYVDCRPIAVMSVCAVLIVVIFIVVRRVCWRRQRRRQMNIEEGKIQDEKACQLLDPDNKPTWRVDQKRTRPSSIGLIAEVLKNSDVSDALFHISKHRPIMRKKRASNRRGRSAAEHHVGYTLITAGSCHVFSYTMGEKKS